MRFMDRLIFAESLDRSADGSRGRFIMNFKNWICLQEIKNSTTLMQSNVDYNQFIDWAKSEADKVNPDKEKFLNFEFQWAEAANNVKLIAYENGMPLGYVGLEKFEDGYKINTLGVKPEARGKGLASVMYDFILSKTKLYSDVMQTQEAKSLWVKLANKYRVLGYNRSSKQNFNVTAQGKELLSTDPEFVLYADEENDNFLVASK